MFWRARVLSLVLAIGLSACGQADRDAEGVDTTRTIVGDTTIVRTLSGSVWGDSVKLVEEVVIGVLDGAEEYLFGQVQDLAIDADGGIYVFDGQVPALRYYDSDGSYVRTLGREGEGPGEYKNASLGIAVRRSDGRVVMRDPRNMRLNVYNPDGSPSDSWRVESGLFTGQATSLDSSDHMYLKILTGRTEPNQPWPVALLHMDDHGQIVDTIFPPTLTNEPGGVSPYAKVWAMGSSGGVVVGVNDRYVIDHYRPAVVYEEGETTSRASCRSIPEFDITAALRTCPELMVRFGGHRAAAGFTVENANLPALKKALVARAAEELEGIELVPVLDIDAAVPLARIDGKLIASFARLAPFGVGNPEPVFLSRGLEVTDVRTMGANGEHLRLRLRDGQVTWPAVAFGVGEQDLEPGARLDAVYTFSADRRSNGAMELHLLDFAPSSSAS